MGSPLTLDSVRSAFLRAFHDAVAAVDPESAVEAAVRRLGLEKPLLVIAIGKAAAAMTRGASKAAPGAHGLVVTDHPQPIPAGFELMLGSHPFPDARSVAAGQAVMATAAEARGDQTLMVLVSGGGSALAEVPADGLEVAGLADLQRRLMAAGVAIEEVNTVRRHLSKLKNGGLAAAGKPQRLVSLVVSDVVDGPASAVASGPTLADGSTAADALAVLARHRLRDDVAPTIIRALQRAAPPDPPAAPHHWEVVADDTVAARAAAASLAEAGIPATVATTSLRGEASHAAVRVLSGTPPGVAHVCAGETTVDVQGSGTGGRNQQAALAAAIDIDGDRAVFAALGTDGIDGPTDAAGAIVDGGTASDMRAAGIDAAAELAGCNAHPTLARVGALVRTGPTGTNVGDLWMAWRG